jgi:hypothetical protein
LTTLKSNGEKSQTQSKNIAKPKVEIYQHFETATKPRKQTNTKLRVPNPQTKKDTKASIAKLKAQTNQQ